MRAEEALSEIVDLIERGEDTKAKLLLKYRTYPNQSAQDYYRWGCACEDLGLTKLAVECYEKAISKDPNNSRYLLALAGALYQLGMLNRTARILQRVLILQDSSTVREFLSRILKEQGRLGAALAVKKESPEESKGLLRYFPPDIGNVHLKRFLELFKGRNIHAEVSVNSLGKTVINMKQEKITPKKAKEHILGRTFLIYYPLMEDKTMSSAFISFLYPDRIREKHKFSPKLADILKQNAINIYSTVLSWELQCALERVNPFHYRLWFFAEKPFHFLWFKRFLETVKERLPTMEPGISCEIGIPTEGIGIGWLEKGFELPLGINPITLERSLFLDREGQPYKEQLEFIKRIIPITFESVKEFCKTPSTFKVWSESHSELKKLCAKCVIIDTIVKRAEAGKRLSREEKIAVILTAGFLKNGKSLVHKILSSTPDYNFSRIERMLSQAPHNPISCIKLEQWFPQYTMDSPCYCVFGEKVKNRYPSPLLHINPALVPTKEERFTLNYSAPKELAMHYLKLRERLTTAEEELLNFFKSNPHKKIRAGEFVIYMKEGKLIVEKRA